MIASRNIDDLHPLVARMARDFLARAKDAGIDLLVTSTFRDNESQDALYAQGRTKPGARVTNARGGSSYHNYRVALDVVPIVGGKPVWGTTGKDGQLWLRVGAIGKSVGFEWAGEWDSFREFPHFQFTGGLTLRDFQSGKTLNDRKRT